MYNASTVIRICEVAPIAKGQMPAATSAADPDDEPPVWCPGLYGFRAVPAVADTTSVDQPLASAAVVRTGRPAGCRVCGRPASRSMHMAPPHQPRR